MPQSIAEAFANLGKTPRDAVRVVQAISDPPATQAEFRSWKQALSPADESDSLERLALRYAMDDFAPQVDALPVHPAVKDLIRKEFLTFRKPPAAAGPALLVGTDPFIAACKIATLRRFPAGPMDWLISGVPKSWIGKMPPAEVPAALWYILKRFGGFRPAFYIHIATAPRNRSLVLEKEVRKAYYRMAKSLELQPAMKGIVCAGWFHDPAALRDAPHLKALNEPYLQHGGRLVTTVGEATPESGFLKHNPERRKAYEEGKQRIRLTLAMWPRSAAIAWAARHPELE